MDLNRINPEIHSAALLESLPTGKAKRAYDSKIIYLISGETSYTVGGGKKSRMAPGNLLFIPAGCVYTIKSKYMRAVVLSFGFTPSEDGKVCPSPALEADFDESLCGRIPEESAFSSPIFIEDLEGERDGLIRMCNIFLSENGFYLAELSAMLKLLLIKIAEHSDSNALPSSMVENLDNYIRENIHDEISNTELGAIFGYHPFYISKLLKDKRGITLHQYVISYRMKYACSLLRTTERAIAEIADDAGFTDASYFTKTFKASFGMTPKEYRNKFSGDHI